MSVQAFRTACAAIVIGASLLMPLPLEAQAFKWWQDEAAQRHLGLTAEQSRRIEDIFRAARPELHRAKNQLDGLEAELGRTVEGADDAAIAQQVGRVEDARADLNKVRTMMLLRIRRVLSTDQRVKLAALHKQRHNQRRPDGRQ
jgi:Spy/CpxP family protein refolding chaperone